MSGKNNSGKLQQILLKAGIDVVLESLQKSVNKHEYLKNGVRYHRQFMRSEKFIKEVKKAGFNPQKMNFMMYDLNNNDTNASFFPKEGDQYFSTVKSFGMTKWTADQICTVYFQSGTFQLAEDLALKQALNGLIFDEWVQLKNQGYITGDGFAFCANGWKLKRRIIQGLFNKVRITCKWRQ